MADELIEGHEQEDGREQELERALGDVAAGSGPASQHLSGL